MIDQRGKMIISAHKCGRIKMQLLEKSKDANKLSFRKEVRNLEFTGTIGNMKGYFCTDSQKRDKVLVKIGKRLFRKNPEHRILNIRFIKGGITIYYKDKSYKFGFFKKKRGYFEVLPENETLSQEFINMILAPEEEE
jgi:hypothetical protein